MGRFVNPDNSAFQAALNSRIYVDKTGMIEYMNRVLETTDAYICNSRPRRFGKSYAANMLAAYYSKGADSEMMFSDLSIGKTQDFKKYLNKFDAGFHMDMQCDKGIMRDGGGVLEYCRMKKIPVQAWSSLQYGYFQGTFLGSDNYRELNTVLNRIASEKVVTPMAVALAWILRYPGATQAVIGTTKSTRVREAAKATEVRLSKKEWYEIYLAAGNDLP